MERHSPRSWSGRTPCSFRCHLEGRYLFARRIHCRFQGRGNLRAERGGIATQQYLLSDECWMGKIDHHDPAKIQWTKIANHPGKPRYRMAAGASEHDQKIYFSGGGEELYDYKGLGADGRPVEPSPVTFAWNLRTSKWEVVNDKTPNPTLDNRGLLVTSEGLIRIGGMEAAQKVTSR